MSLKTHALTLLAVAVMAAPAWAQNGLPTLVVQPVSLTETTGVSGVVEGTETAEARARINGTLVQLNVARGDWVSKGQVLAVVEDKKLPQQLRALNLQVDVAQKNAARLKRLLAVGAASPLQAEQAEAEAASLKAQQQNTAQNTADGNILAPLSGQFVTLNATSGTVLMSGESLGTVAAAPLRLRLAVPENQAANLTVSQTLALQSDTATSLGDATIRRMFPQVENGRITVELALEDATAKTLRVGQNVVASIPTRTRNALAIPQGYVHVRNNLAFVTLKNGEDVLVQTGYPRADGFVEVLSGLKAGDELAAQTVVHAP